jgi:heme-degrading monooxygenase HmoA
MAIQVFFIAKIRDLNSDYQEYSKRLREMSESSPGFISIRSETIGDTEITVSTWRDRAAVKDWATDPVHKEAKARSSEWYHWVRGIHVETVDD